MLIKNLGVIALFWVVGGQYAFAFECNFSQSINSKINLSDVSNIGDEIVVYDYNKDQCTGLGSALYIDSLRVSIFEENSVLKGSGLALFFKDNGIYYNYSSAIYRCVWPWSGADCPATEYTDGTYPMNGELILRRTSTIAANASIPPNSLLGRIRFQQRGNYDFSGASWGHVGYDVNIYNNDALSFSTCDIEPLSQSQIINLPTMSISQFSGVGSTIGAQKFSINLNCQADVSIYASVKDSVLLSNPGPNLSLDQSSTAAGVGIQLLYDSHPIQFGDAQQFFVGVSSSLPTSTHTVYFEARYVQTSASMTPGSIGAEAVILFEYL